MLYELFQRHLRHDPTDPEWEGRDRFVLSAGHASLALYLQLYLSGYGLEMDDLRKARTFGSRTPGHPEWGHTAGVEVTTGPLGQGIANAVGMAMSARRTAALLDPGTPYSESVFGRRIWCLASDGDLEEGISHEAASLAGALALEGLVVIWDDNQISIEGDTAVTFRDDVPARFRSYDWAVIEVGDAEDRAEIARAFEAAPASHDRPVLIRLRTRIGHPMPALGGTAAAHSGAPGADEVAATKTLLGLDPSQHFTMPDDLLAHARDVARRGAAAHAEWDRALATWQQDHPEQAALRAGLRSKVLTPAAVIALEALRSAPSAVATRVASGRVLDSVWPHLPWLWGGSADLAETNNTALAGARSFVRADLASEQWHGGPDGTLIHFGIREHAMGGVLNGIALDGHSVPFGATFFVFSDYMRPSVRLAALMGVRTVYVWTHDSVAVGEDGPTHQPVEQLWAFRGIPGLSVVRPADWVETVDAWTRVLSEPSGPTALVLSRQACAVVGSHVAAGDGARRGAYVLAGAAGTTPDALIIATGAEVGLALAARERLAGAHDIAVISAPCLEWFEEQPETYRDAVLPPSAKARVSVEAGTGLGWHRYVGDCGTIVSVEEFGASGAGDLVLSAREITLEAVVEAVLRSVEQAGN